MKISFCGDMVWKNSNILPRMGSFLKESINSSDINCVNLEAPIYTEGTYGIKKSGPHHYQSPKTPEWLEENGFNLICVANNHIMDYGEKALLNTVHAFKKAEIIGYGKYPDAYDFKIIKHNNESIGFLALTQHEFGCVDANAYDKLGTPFLTSPKVFKSIDETRQKVDKLIILAHGGLEYTNTPLPEWRELYQTFIDLGVDVVIGSHPHVPQGYEIYKGKPIVYSLGNFIFEKPQTAKLHTLWNVSYMITYDTYDNSIQQIPLIFDINNNKIEIDTKENASSHLQYLNNLLNNEKEYKAYIQSLKDSMKNSYIIGMKESLGILNPKEKIKNVLRLFMCKKIKKGNITNMLNLFQCESHRWLIQNFLSQNNK